MKVLWEARLKVLPEVLLKVLSEVLLTVLSKVLLEAVFGTVVSNNLLAPLHDHFAGESKP